MRRFVQILLCYSLASWLISSPASAQRAQNGLFKSREIYNDNTQKFTKWTRMLMRHKTEVDSWQSDEGGDEASVYKPLISEEAAALPPPSLLAKKAPGADECAGEGRVACNREKWEAFVSASEELAGEELLNAVNLYMNQSPYIIDPVNWNLPDYWATPGEFFLKDGDCEDYAISKYVTLKRLGYPTDKMRLVVLRDENLRVAHAVLAVELDGVHYILDNQANAILPHTKILHYRPVYSINETGWWLHQRNRFNRY